MKIPFYQTTWNDISLVNLAGDLGHSLEALPDAKFYAAYYEKLSSSQISEKWKTSKKYQTQWLKEQIEKYGGIQAKILSVGAGTGIIEISLIKAGYDIHLQEYQEYSLKILGANNLTTCHTKDLKEINDVKYDIIVVIAMTYALSDKELKSFFNTCSTLLSENGKLIILDTSLSWWEIYAYFRNKSHYKKTHLLWGAKRGICSFKGMANGLKFLSHWYYSNHMKKLNVKKFMGVPFNLTPHWQMMVFQK